MSTTLSNLLYAGFRIAGVTELPGRTPSTEQYADALDIANRMVSSWNVDPLKILGDRIDAYTLTAGQKLYTLGGGSVTTTNLSLTRPVQIDYANIIYNTSSPVVRFPMALLTPQQWAGVQVQDITGTIPWALYNDESYPISNIYVYGQALAAYQLELYTWQTLSAFTATGNTVDLPPGYELAFTFNLAVLLAASFPTQANIRPESVQIAREALATIESKNAPVVRMSCDPAVLGLGGRRGQRGADYYAYKGNTW